MGNINLTSNNAVVGVVAEAVEYLTKPPARPIDLTLPASMQDEDPDLLMKRAKEELGIDGSQEFNFAVVGARGVGKSAFINGIRMLEDSHPDAAPLQEVESTTKIKAYKHPQVPHAVLWELPGGGVPDHPALTYFTDKKLYAFDCIFILSADRFQRVDFEVAKAAVQFKKRFVFVRTKADLAVKRITERDKLSVADASKKLRETVEASFREGLRLAGMADKWQQLTLFVVSSKRFTDYHAYTSGPLSTTTRQGVHPTEDEEEDEQQKMDEDQVYNYIVNSIITRTRRTMSRSKSMGVASRRERR